MSVCHIELCDIVPVQDGYWKVETISGGRECYNIIICPCKKDGVASPVDLIEQGIEVICYSVEKAIACQKYLVDTLKALAPEKIPAFLKAFVSERKKENEERWSEEFPQKNNSTAKPLKPSSAEKPERLFTVAFTEYVQRTTFVDIPAVSVEAAIDEISENYCGKNIPDGWILPHSTFLVVAVQDLKKGD